MAAAPEQPKKAVTAFWIWLAEHREALGKELGTNKPPAVSKLAGERWKALPEDQRAPYEAKSAAQKAEYEKAMEEFKSQGGVPQKRRSAKDKDQGGKKQKDPEAPKKPVGGAYGVYLAEHRAEISKSLPADHKITDVAKAAGERWRALSEEDRKPFEAKFSEKSAAYKKAMEEYKKSGGQAAGEEDEAEGEADDGEAAKKPRGKRAAASPPAASPPAKRGRSAKAAQAGPAVDIDAALLKQAESLGFADALRNLAAREDVTKAGKTHKELLDALQASKGLVNPAKRALLGA